MAVNVKLLKKVRKLIAAEPRRLDMEQWGAKVQSMIMRPVNPPPCGTVACLAGWTVLASKPRAKWKSLFRRDGFIRGPIAHRAARLLGIPYESCPFYRTSWTAPEVLAWIDRQIDAAAK